MTGCRGSNSGMGATCSRSVSEPNRTFLPGNTLAWSTPGSSAGLDSSAHGTHSMRRTKAAQIYRKTGNLRAVQLLLGHTKLESTVQYLGFTIAASCVPEAVAAHPPRKLVLFDGRSSREMGRCWLPQSRSWLRPESESSIGARRKLTSMGKSGA